MIAEISRERFDRFPRESKGNTPRRLTPISVLPLLAIIYHGSINIPRADEARRSRAAFFKSFEWFEERRVLRRGNAHSLFDWKLFLSKAAFSLSSFPIPVAGSAGKPRLKIDDRFVRISPNSRTTDDVFIYISQCRMRRVFLWANRCYRRRRRRLGRC